jgi:hypothetical protein
MCASTLDGQFGEEEGGGRRRRGGLIVHEKRLNSPTKKSVTERSDERGADKEGGKEGIQIDTVTSWWWCRRRFP